LAAPKTRPGTKQAELVAMLRRPGAASVDEIVGVISLAGSHRSWRDRRSPQEEARLIINSEKVDGRGRVYRI
jgi:hypothetical protein